MMWDDTFCLSETCKYKDKCDRTTHPRPGIYSYIDFTEACAKEKKKHFVPLPKRRKVKEGK